MAQIRQRRPAVSGSLFEHMRTACSEARISDAAALYDAHPDGSPDAALLRARIYLKQALPREAMRLLLSPALKRLEPTREAVRLMLLGIAESRVNQFEAADDYFDRAAAVGGDLTFDGELAYWRGRRYLEERRLPEARAQLEAMEPPASIELRAKARTLESGILIQQQRYTDAASVLMRMIDDLESSDADLESRSWGLRTLAMLARELDYPEARAFVKRRATTHQWTPDFSVSRFQTLKAAAWCHALEGDYFNAFRLLKMAGANPPNDAWRAMISLDRAYLAKCLGENRWSTDELAEAEEILGRIDWRTVHEEEVVALIIAAELIAPIDPARALNYTAQFSELPPSLNPLLHFRYDRRLTALADYVSGVVQHALGNRQAAIAKLKKSWDVYDEIRYQWRAGRTALRLYELTNDAQWLHRAEEKLRNYQASWLHDELAAHAGLSRAAVDLTPAQLRVFEMICEGRSTRDITELTGRSEFTIRNHVKAILKAFGVSNRTALMAEAMKRGLIGESPAR